MKYFDACGIAIAVDVCTAGAAIAVGALICAVMWSIEKALRLCRITEVVVSYLWNRKRFAEWNLGRGEVIEERNCLHSTLIDMMNEIDTVDPLGVNTMTPWLLKIGDGGLHPAREVAGLPGDGVWVPKAG